MRGDSEQNGTSVNPWDSAVSEINGDTGRLLGMVLALSGEVFTLKAELERLKRAGELAGALGKASLAEVGNSAEFKAWLRAAQNSFPKVIFDPWLKPDRAPDLTHIVRNESKASQSA